MEDLDYPKIPEDAFFNEEDILCHADGKPVDDGVYKNENGDLVIVEGNSGDRVIGQNVCPLRLFTACIR